MLRERVVIGVLFLITALLMLGVARCGVSGSGLGHDNAHIIRPSDSPAAGPSGSAGPSASALSSPVAAQPAATAGPGGPGTLYADRLLVLPMARATRVGRDGDLSAYSGRRAVGTSLRVLSVPADEGFWVGDGGQDRVWVELTGNPDESPYDVDQNDHVSFTGTVVRNRPGFARSVGVTDQEGRDLLEAEGQHVSVRKSVLRLST